MSVCFFAIFAAAKSLLSWAVAQFVCWILNY